MTGTLISDACTPVASWNFNPVVTTGPFGALAVESGTTRGGLTATFVDSTGAEVDPAGGQQIQLVVADQTIAGITAEAGPTPQFTLAGHRPGTTHVEVRLVDHGDVAFHSGAIPLIVYAGPENPRPSFLMRKNGIWCVLVTDGALVTDACGRMADPGRLNAVVGEISEHYFFRRIDPGCTQVNLAGPVYRFTYDFEDHCIARFIIGDHDPNLLTLHLEGLTPGDTWVHFQFFRNDTLEFSSPAVPVHVEPAPPPETGSAGRATFGHVPRWTALPYAAGRPDPTPIPEPLIKERP